MDDTARLGLPYILGGQALKHITHNEALQKLDMLVQPCVESMSVTAPPPNPIEGEAYIVPTGATGAWAGHSAEMTVFQSGVWSFYDPASGWQAYDRATGTLRLFSGAEWVAVAATGSGLPHLGINASADTTNRLAVSAPATLFTHSGNGHQLKLNKAAAGDTASLLFQTNWSGRAEMGLMGDNSWRLKISANGSSWTDALTVDPSNAAITTAGILRPATDNSRTLGASGARWSAVWAATGTIQTSDERFKTDIAPTDLGLDFVLALKPVRYRWKDGGDGKAGQRLHYGLIAQQVRDALDISGAEDFAGHVLSDTNDPGSQQALRYDQFIAPLVAAVQTLAARVGALEEKTH